MSTLTEEEKKVPFPLDSELHARIRSVVDEYAGKISLAAALGILELVKLDIYRDL